MNGMADGKPPTWEHGLPVFFAIMAYLSSGWSEYVLIGLVGAWLAILLLWHCGWRKVTKERENG